MGAPTRCYSLLVARAPLQGAHPYLLLAGGIRYAQTALLSGDAFSVLAIRIRRLSIRNMFQNSSYILQF